MLWRDFTFAARTLAKSPVFAVTAIVAIALGIGAGTAIFSVTNAVPLRPLPYKNPDRLFFAISDMRQGNVKDFPLWNATFIDLRNAAAALFQEMGAVNTGRITVPREGDSPEQIRVAAVTPNFFRLIDGRPNRAGPRLRRCGWPAARTAPASRRRPSGPGTRVGGHPRTARDCARQPPAPGCHGHRSRGAGVHRDSRGGIADKGYVAVPESPGLGIELNDDVVKAHLRRPAYFEPTPIVDDKNASGYMTGGPWPHYDETGKWCNCVTYE